MLKDLFTVFLYLSGFGSICYYFDWKLALAILILQWAQNRENSLIK